MDKKPVGLHIDSEVLADGKLKARELKISFSRYIEDLIRLNSKTTGRQLDRVEDKLDKLLSGGLDVTIHGSGSDTNMVYEVNNKLLSREIRRDISDYCQL